MSARSEALILTRVKNAADKGKGYQLGAGYYDCWKKDGKKLADAGKIVIRGGRYFLPGKQTSK